MDALYEDKFAKYFRDSEHAVIEQCWLEATASMTEGQFRAGVQRLAELIEREHLPNVIVDVVKMGYRPAADFEDWRQAFIIPRYNSAGVRKFAFIFPSDFPSTVENGVSPAAEGNAMFPFGYFASHEGALAWLAI